MTRPGAPSSAEQKVLDAAIKARREATRYRVDGVELPEGQEPDWDALTDQSAVEKYAYGAGWSRVLPIRPVMAHHVMAPVTRTYLDADYKKRSETIFPLEGPIWPPR